MHKKLSKRWDSFNPSNLKESCLQILINVCTELNLQQLLHCTSIVYLHEMKKKLNLGRVLNLKKATGDNDRFRGRNICIIYARICTYVSLRGRWSTRRKRESERERERERKIDA